MDDLIFGNIGEKIGEYAAGAFNSAMKALWNAAITMLTAVFGFIDKYTTPNVDPLNGAFSGILPLTIYLGLVVLVLMAFVQIGKAVASGGRGFGRVLIGLTQYAVISVGGLGVLAAMITACNALAHGILESAGIADWKGLGTTQNGWGEAAVEGISGVVLGIIALLCVIPAAIGFAIEAIAREAGILILGATIPILAGGLISDKTKGMFWTGLRWMLALLFMTPATALAVVIGLKLAIAAAGGDGQQQGAGHAIAGALVSGIVLIIALTCPMALFKLFAFVDPNSLAGANVRSALGGGGSGGGGGGSAGSSEGGAEAAGDSRFEQAVLGALGPVGGAIGALSSAGPKMAEAGSRILDVAGAGHPGGPTSSGKGASSSNRSGGDPEDADTTGSDNDAPESGSFDPSDPDGGDGSTVTPDGGDAATAADSPTPATDPVAPEPADGGSSTSAATPPLPVPSADPPTTEGGGSGGGGSPNPASGARGAGGAGGAGASAETAAVVAL